MLLSCPVLLNPMSTVLLPISPTLPFKVDPTLVLLLLEVSEEWVPPTVSPPSPPTPPPLWRPSSSVTSWVPKQSIGQAL